VEHATQPIPYLPAPGAPEHSPPAVPRAGFWRRHRVAVAMTALALGGAAVGVGVGLDLTRGGSSTTVTAVQTPATSAPASSAATRPSSRQRRHILGVIQSVSGSTWTVRTRAGASITVIVTPQTQFGSAKNPGSPEQFAAGDSVVVAGAADDRQLTATRIVAAPESGAPTA
jgi:Domain of unknown function (DUF5666)